MQDAEARRRTSLISFFVFVLIEFILVWAIASQISYLILVRGDSSATHLFIVCGLLIGVSVAGVGFGALSSRATGLWGDQRCGGGLLKKSEVLTLHTALIGTIMGTAAWDFVMVYNALMFGAWDPSEFWRDYMLVDFLLFRIVLPLWMHLAGAVIKTLISIAFAAKTGVRIRDGTFCEMPSLKKIKKG